ncbi:ATP-binding protein [bacterium]|nr:ATP-binding protein [bacterium]
MYIHRELEKTIKPFLKRKEILAIVGARQVGKTTFLKHLFSELKKTKKIEFLTFEREKDLTLFENIEDFKEYYKDYEILIIDEFHYAKEGGKKLKYLFDTTKTKFIISGSSSLELTFETGKYLVGRMIKFYLTPFSFREFLSFKHKILFNLLDSRFKDIFSQKINFKDFFGEELNSRLRKYFEEYLIFGGYPAVALAKTEKEKIKILESILENYLLKDIKGLLDLKTKEELMKICEFLSTQIGSLLNYQELSNTSNLKYQDVLKHLEILKNTFIVDLLKPFYKNPRTELVKTPKVYFLDNGFRNYLLLDFRKPEKRDDLGKLVENFVFSSLKRQEEVKLNYWRTKSKAEIDFVLQKNGEIVPIEVKYSFSPSIGKSFYSFIEKFSPKKGYIFTQGFCGIKKIKNTKIYFIPVYYL